MPFNDRVRCAVAVVLVCVVFAGCAATRADIKAEIPPMHVASEFADDEKLIGVYDPWEQFNLEMYRFNYNFDKYIYLPVVAGYEFITPVAVQKSVTNFFENVGEVRNLYNNAFQLKGKRSLITLGRFVTNTTIGIGGLFDPATPLGLKKQYEDFGQTLGIWGVGAGPYLVVPVLGPNTVRSTGGFAVDAGVRYAVLSAPLENNLANGPWISSGVSGVEAVDARHKISFRYFESGYPFEYYIVRYLYLKYSEFQQMK
jgi:phospholipid-binding lipoprotein MlaA